MAEHEARLRKESVLRHDARKLAKLEEENHRAEEKLAKKESDQDRERDIMEHFNQNAKELKNQAKEHKLKLRGAEMQAE